MAVVNEYTDETFMPFGKHLGTKLANVPGEYLLWLWDSSEKGERLSDGKLRKYIQDNFHAIEMDAMHERQKKFYERK